MRWIGKLFGTRSDPVTMKDLMRIVFGGAPTKAGVSIDGSSALTISAVYAAVRIIAETVASLSLFVYQRKDRGKDRAVNHPLYGILHDIPNQYMDSFIFWETLMAHALLGGNGYAHIARDGAGRVRELNLIPYTKVAVELTAAKKKQYRVQTDDGVVVYHDEEILHIPGLGFDGLKGYTVISLARESFGLAKATEDFGAQFFGSGTTSGGFLKHPNNLSEPAQKRLKTALENHAYGIENAHRIMVLEEGMSFERNTMPLEDAQFLQTRKFQISEVARWFRVPPHMLADLERSTNNNIEHQSIEFVMHTIRPWVKRLERAMNRKLLTKTEREEFFIEFEIDSLLRGDIKSRYEAYAIGRNNGWLSADDIRERENMNPIPGGDIYYMPLNMCRLGEFKQKGEVNDSGQKTDPGDPGDPAGN